MWFNEHWRLVMSGGIGTVLLVLWRAGFFNRLMHVIQQLRAAYRDQERLAAIQKCTVCEEKLAASRLALRVRLEEDDGREEIHLQDLADKKQMSALIERLKCRLRDNRITFEDLL